MRLQLYTSRVITRDFAEPLVTNYLKNSLTFTDENISYILILDQLSQVLYINLCNNNFF